MHARRGTAGSLGVALAVVAVMSAAPGSPDITPANLRKPAPDFTIADSKDTPITLSGYKGKVVLLDFWATWCTGCKVEIPWYMEFDKKYRTNGLASIGAAMDDEGWSAVKPYLMTHPITYPIVVGNPDLSTPYQVTNLPVTLLIDRNGRIADWHVGMVDKTTWEQEIRTLLQEGAHK